MTDTSTDTNASRMKHRTSITQHKLHEKRQSSLEYSCFDGSPDVSSLDRERQERKKRITRKEGSWVRSRCLIHWSKDWLKLMMVSEKILVENQLQITKQGRKGNSWWKHESTIDDGPGNLIAAVVVSDDGERNPFDELEVESPDRMIAWSTDRFAWFMTTGLMTGYLDFLVDHLNFLLRAWLDFLYKDFLYDHLLWVRFLYFFNNNSLNLRRRNWFNHNDLLLLGS